MVQAHCWQATESQDGSLLPLVAARHHEGDGCREATFLEEGHHEEERREEGILWATHAGWILEEGLLEEEGAAGV